MYKLEGGGGAKKKKMKHQVNYNIIKINPGQSTIDAMQQHLQESLKTIQYHTIMVVMSTSSI